MLYSELDLLGHGGEEPVFDPLLIQQGQGAVGGPQFVAAISSVAML